MSSTKSVFRDIDHFRKRESAHGLRFLSKLGTFFSMKRTDLFKNGAIALAMTILALSYPLTASSQDSSRLIGRWNLTVQGSDGAHPSWLEVRRTPKNGPVGKL